ncbi:MAG: hypothetical protein JWP85_979 [Rhodoglobus sp.]|nr:hypothetical protein [Rhodoglobus sp.]
MAGDENVLTLHPPIGADWVEVFNWGGDDLRNQTVCIQGSSSELGPWGIGITADQARELAGHLVRCAIHLENPSAAGWVEAALTIGLITNPTGGQRRRRAIG